MRNKIVAVVEPIAKGDKGDKGDAATIQVGTVTTLAPGEQATVTNVGTIVETITISQL